MSGVTSPTSVPPVDRGLVRLLEKASVGVVGGLVVLVPTVFWRSAHTVFTVPKATVVVVGAVLLLLLRVAIVVAGGWPVRRRWAPGIAVSVLAFLLILSAERSDHAALAAVGSGQRYSGLVTWLAYLAVFWATATTFARRSCRPVVLAVIGAAVVVAGYGLVQVAGFDPFSWAVSLSFGGDVQSTLGNPNFTAAFLSVGLPALVAGALMVGSSSVFRMCSTAGMGAATVVVAECASTQGYVGVWTSLLVVAVWWWSSGTTPLRAGGLVLAPVLLLVAVVPVGLGGLPTTAWLGLLVAGASWGWFLHRWLATLAGEDPHEVGPMPRAGRGLVIGLVSGAGSLCIALVVFGPRLLDRVGERRHLWEVAWRMFRERPWLGHGLETYGAAFGEFRPVEHADSLGPHLSDSAHNLPLGLLASGGALTLLSYLSLLLVVACSGWRGIARARGDERILLAAVGAGWLAFQFQSLVSVDTVGLGVVQWAMAGVLIASGWRSKVEDEATRKASGSAAQALHWGTGVVCVAALVLVIPPVLRPLRADLARGDAHRSIAIGDLDAAAAHLDRAIRLEPRNGTHLVVRADVFRAAGQREEAYRRAVTAADLLPGNPGAAWQAARDAVATWGADGRLAEARAWYREAIARDPYSEEIVAEAAEFLESTGRLGEADRLRSELRNRRASG